MRTKRLLIGVSCVAVLAPAMFVHYGGRPLQAQTPPAATSTSTAKPSPNAHWEPYKNRNAKPSIDQKLTDPVLTGAIDLHAHHGPDAYERQWDAFEIAKLAKERGMRAIVLKNHWTETAGLAQLIRKYGTQGTEVYGSVTLDTPVGVLRETALVEGVHRIVARPGPASELRAPVVVDGCLNLGAAVHHEGAVLHDGLADRMTLEHQHFSVCVAGCELDFDVALDDDGGVRVERVIGNLE